MQSRLKTSACFFVLLLATACAGPLNAEIGFASISDVTRQRVGHPVHWERGGYADGQVAAHIRELLRHDLSAADAVHITLLNNRELQALYESLGLAYADIVQACTIANPSLTLLGRFPIAKGVTNGEIGFMQGLVDLLLMPLKRSLSVQSFITAQHRLVHHVLETAFAAQAAFIRVQAAQRMLEVRAQILQELRVDSKLAALRDHAAGVGDVDLALGRATYQQVELDYIHDQIQLNGEREALIQLLSLNGDQVNFRVESTFPDLPASEPSSEDLREVAILSRWDLSAILEEENTIRRALEITRKTWWLASVTIGVATSRDAEGTHVAGPTLVLELPIFNRRRAHIMRLEAQLREVHQRAASVRIRIESEVRKAQNAVRNARAIAQPYQAVLVPLRKRVIQLSRHAYGLGKISPYELLLATQAEMRTRRDAVSAMRDYWLSRVELDRAISAHWRARDGDA